MSDPRIRKAAFGSGQWTDLKGVETYSTQKQQEMIDRGREEMRRRKEDEETTEQLEPKILFPANDQTPSSSGKGRSRGKRKWARW